MRGYDYRSFHTGKKTPADDLIDDNQRPVSVIAIKYYFYGRRKIRCHPVMDCKVRAPRFEVCVLVIAIFSIFFIIAMGALQNATLTERKIVSLFLDDHEGVAAVHRSLRFILESTNKTPVTGLLHHSNTTQGRLSLRDGKKSNNVKELNQNRSSEVHPHKRNHLKRDTISHFLSEEEAGNGQVKDSLASSRVNDNDNGDDTSKQFQHNNRGKNISTTVLSATKTGLNLNDTRIIIQAKSKQARGKPLQKRDISEMENATRINGEKVTKSIGAPLREMSTPTKYHKRPLINATTIKTVDS